MAEYHPPRKEQWTWIVGATLRRPWIWLWVLMGVAALIAGPVLHRGEPETTQRRDPEVVPVRLEARTWEEHAAAGPDRPVAVSVFRLAGYRRDAGLLTPAEDVLQRLVRSDRRIVGLDASVADPTPENLRRIAQLVHLERLRLGGTEWFDQREVDLSPLVPLPDLRLLVLSGVRDRALDAASIAAMPRLEELVASHPADGFTPGQAEQLATSPTLRRLTPPAPAEGLQRAPTLLPLRASPRLEEVGVATQREAEALAHLLPGVTLRPMREPVNFSIGAWMTLAGAGMFAAFGAQLVLWTSGPWPAAVPGFPAAHRRVAWVFTAAVLVPVGLSAWGTGLPPLLTTAAVAAAWIGLWWLQVGGLAPLGSMAEPGRMARDARERVGDFLPLLAVLAAAGLAYAAREAGAGGLAAAGFACLAALFGWRLDRFLRGVERRPGADRLQGAEAGGSRNAASGGFGSEGDWPAGTQPHRQLQRIALGAAAGVAFYALWLLAGRDQPRDSLFALAAPGVIGWIGVQPVAFTVQRWRRRFAMMPLGVPLPGGRRAWIDAHFNGFARDLAGLWPMVAAAGVVGGLLAADLSSVQLPLPPVWSGVGIAAVVASLLLTGYALTVLLWRRPVLLALAFVLGLVLVGSGFFGILALDVFLGVNGWWTGLLTFAAVFALALGADRTARRRAAATEWGR